VSSISCIVFLASFDTSHRRHSRELIRVTLSPPLLARLLRPWTLVVPPPKDIESERDLVFSLASSLLQSPVGQGRGSSVISLAHRVGRGSRGHASFPLGESCLSIPRFPLSFFIGGKDGGGKDLCSRDMYKIGIDCLHTFYEFVFYPLARDTRCINRDENFVFSLILQ